jgi:hypothetical protein
VGLAVRSVASAVGGPVRSVAAVVAVASAVGGAQAVSAVAGTVASAQTVASAELVEASAAARTVAGTAETNRGHGQREIATITSSAHFALVLKFVFEREKLFCFCV